MRESPLACQTVQDAHVGPERSIGQKVVGDVGAIAWLVRGGPGNRQKLAKTPLAIREAVAERSDAYRQRRSHRLEARAMVRSEGAGRERRGRADRAAGESRPGVELENVQHDAVVLDATAGTL